MKATAAAALAVAGGLGLLGCTTEDVVGEGDLELTLSGAQALEEGFPHREGELDNSFVDGWSTLTFDGYVVVVESVELTDPETGAVVARWDGNVALDIRAEGGKSQPLTVFEGLPAERLDFGITIGRAGPDTESHDVDAADMERLRSGGHSYLIRAQAEAEDGRSLELDLAFEAAARYYRCNNGKDRTRGIVVENEKTTGAFVYSHAVHLFWDTLSTGNEEMRLEPFWMAAGEDAVVTMEELDEMELIGMRDASGDPILYDDGGLLSSDELTLGAFVRKGAEQSLHFNGIGFCRFDPID